MTLLCCLCSDAMLLFMGKKESIPPFSPYQVYKLHLYTRTLPFQSVKLGPTSNPTYATSTSLYVGCWYSVKEQKLDLKQSSWKEFHLKRSAEKFIIYFLLPSNPFIRNDHCRRRSLLCRHNHLLHPSLHHLQHHLQLVVL